MPAALPQRAHALTIFADDTKVNAKVKYLTWAQVCQRFINPFTYPSKKACPLVKLGRFEHDTRRRGGKLLTVDALMGDYDAEKVSAEQAQALLHEAGIEA
ncbi:MAG: hypothetical protein ACRC1H_10015, partial [Caldilineaceae bacterium]